ncbi:hypothetical protein PPERSA_03118 [Pseudocohnilembus persalinus]|uniref:Amino acid transporter transmembrane domain-containing protein n=1 Tax=Pseudocohnilembus persalinus TaxID=266149 RepID=A0A0V0QRH8_PSEPJ|nr:hypothetical protein PPERSA_03118 [Pseudocohnilembus persalinus]|eukprot:KRX04727.1 hypothetical protein PPERSA_03118 [Pseudocohnilembus persalinus]
MQQSPQQEKKMEILQIADAPVHRQPSYQITPVTNRRKYSSYKEKLDQLTIINEDLENEYNNEQSDFIHGLYNQLKTIIGVGLLVIPYGFKATGWIQGIITLSISALLSAQCVFKLNDILESLPAPIFGHQIATQYGYIGQVIFGQYMKIIIQILTLTYHLGSCTSYLIFFHDFFNQVFSHLAFNVPPLVQAFFLILIILPVTFDNNIHHLYTSSMFGVVCVFISCIIILYNDVHTLIENDEPKQINNTFNLNGFLYFLGISIFSFQGVGTVFYIKSSLQNPSEIKSIYGLSILIALILYIICGTISYFSYGKNINVIILDNISQGLVTKLLYSLSLLMTYPLIGIPCFQIIENYAQQIIIKYKNRESMTHNQIQKVKDYTLYVVRTVCLLSIYLVAICIPQFSQFISQIGGISGILFQITIPTLLFLKFYEKKLPILRLIFESLLLATSLGLAIIILVIEVRYLL